MKWNWGTCFLSLFLWWLFHGAFLNCFFAWRLCHWMFLSRAYYYKSLKRNIFALYEISDLWHQRSETHSQILEGNKIYARGVYKKNESWPWILAHLAMQPRQNGIFFSSIFILKPLVRWHLLQYKVPWDFCGESKSPPSFDRGCY